MTKYWDMSNDQIKRIVRRKVREYDKWEGYNLQEARQVRQALKNQINELSAILDAREAQMFLL